MSHDELSDLTSKMTISSGAEGESSNTKSLVDFLDAEKVQDETTKQNDLIKSLVMSNENPMEKSSLFRSIIEQTEPSSNNSNENLLRPFSECVEQYYRILYRVCECTEELKQELRHVKSERDQMSEDLIQAENAYTDVKKRNEKLKLIINEHKMVRRDEFFLSDFRFFLQNTETLKRFSEESVRYTEEQKQKYAVLKQHAQEKLNE